MDGDRIGIHRPSGSTAVGSRPAASGVASSAGTAGRMSACVHSGRPRRQLRRNVHDVFAHAIGATDPCWSWTRPELA
jgi:hypothetical protein